METFSNEKFVTLVTPNTPTEVEYMLSKAEPAEQPGIPQPYLDAGVQKGDYPRLEQDEILDGVWACCSCPKENGLIHFKGAYPFKHLDCVGCGHILCRDCVTSDIIVPWDEKRIILPMDRNQGELRLFQACPSCGLSHRAIKSASRDYLDRPLCWLPKAPHPHSQAEKCLCSLPGDFNWPKYMIGQPYTFRMNAEQARHECKQKLQRNKLAMSDITRTPDQFRSPLERIDSMWDCVGARHGDSPDGASPRSSLQNTPEGSPTLPPAQPRNVPRKQRPDLTVNTSTCLLQRSNAVRIKSSHTPRSLSYQETPVSARPRVRQRAETWANIPHQQGSPAFGSGAALYTPRSGAQMRPLRIDQYTAKPESTGHGESLVQDSGRKISNQDRSHSQYATRRDSYAQAGLDRIERLGRPASSLTMHAPQPLRRAVTENILLAGYEQPPRLTVSHGRNESTLESAHEEEDWKETYRMMVKMNLVEE